MITMTAPTVRRALAALPVTAPSRKDRALAAFAAFALHALILVGGGAAFVQPAEYGVETGPSGIDVDLVAAPPAAVEAVAPAPPPAPPAEEVPAEPETAVIDTEPVAPPPAETPAVRTPLPVAATPAMPSEAVGDGSSPVPGKDATTFSSRAGALNDTPSYLKNPPPRYPEEARQAGQEGVVLLRVAISASGKAEEVVVYRGSGFSVLDEAAVRAVSKWRFRPAKVAGGIPVASSAEIPVRFQLNMKA